MMMKHLLTLIAAEWREAFIRFESKDETARRFKLPQNATSQFDLSYTRLRKAALFSSHKPS
jgi:hypothetical protein